MENNTEKDKTFYHCHLARFVIEAETPLSIRSGQKNIFTDACINRDVNGLPFIPGTTLAGLLRHAITDKEQCERIFGKQEQGSTLCITEGKMMLSENCAVDGLLNRETLKDCDKEYLTALERLPIRQHVRLTHHGTTEKTGKFDEEVIPKGVRFCFELELRGKEQEESKTDFENLLKAVATTTFRIGGGSRKGFGRIKVQEVSYCNLDLKKKEDMEKYLSKSSSLATKWEGYTAYSLETTTPTEVRHYKLELQPDNFLFFSSGLPNNDADNSIVKERFVTWKNGVPTLTEEETTLLVPASSVKGAIAHRTAYHYNRLTGVFADDKEIEKHVGTNNKAVCALFGTEDASGCGENARRGIVLFSDVVKKMEGENSQEKMFNHVKIDRFTGGASDGALFSQQPLYAPEEKIVLCLELLPDAEVEKDEHIIKAFEAALQDICKGYLPLGGSVNRGHGFFKGTLKRNEEQL